MNKYLLALLFLACLFNQPLLAKPVTYVFDPTHTYPSFQADHMGGVSKWRGKINQSSGQATVDLDTKTGSVEVTMQMDSIDFGLDIMNEKARSAELFDTANYPTAVYKGDIAFDGDKPFAVDGTLTMHGVTKPLVLYMTSWKCFTNPMIQKEVCGADVYASLDRSEYGINLGKDYGFSMAVQLAIQVEGVRQDDVVAPAVIK